MPTCFKQNFSRLPLYFLTGFLLLISGYGFGQNKEQSIKNSIKYFNTFQKYSYSVPNADSAVYYMQKLASRQAYLLLLRDLVHNSFAQSFIEDGRNDSVHLSYKHLQRQILNKIIKDTTKLLSETTKPMVLWIQVQDHKDNLDSLKLLTHEFINTQLSGGDIYTNRIARYGLLIYQTISTHPELQVQAQKIFHTIDVNLKNDTSKVSHAVSGVEAGRRAWSRYLYAYTNYVKAQETDNSIKKEKFLKTAFDFSPDITDRNNSYAYFYDMVFLFHGAKKSTFSMDYIDYMIHHSKDNTEILSFLLQTALTQPEYKARLEKFYTDKISSTQSFHNYWLNAVNAQAVPAPLFSLSLLDQDLFSSKELSGKWILMDYWGTWCGPCRQEHPDMQRFYDSTVLQNQNKIALLTIACSDTKKKVEDYMAEHHYSFPVAMSDETIEKTFPVRGYPTKILITPQGKYLTVPFGIDWVSFVKEYADL